jgi:heterodisulfide reductase subunit A2
LTLAEVTGISGKAGDFEVRIRQSPRYVDADKCIACGQCAEKCPKKVVDTYNEKLVKRKAIYVPYSQAVPLKYTIDAENCIYFTKGKCRACEKFCPSGAINFEDKEKEIVVSVGAVVAAPGFRSFDPGGSDVYAYDRSPDVVTSIEFERILSATGPYGGHLLRPSGKKEEKQPQKIAWIQCVGSRDINRCGNDYCSAVCCMYAVKQALIAKDHSPIPLDCAVFYIDMRTQGKDFDRYYEKARQTGVRFIRSRIHSVTPVDGCDDLLLRYVREDGSIQAEMFDMVVLSTGLEIDTATAELADRLDIQLDDHRFVKTDGFHPVATSVPGIYACGAFTGPKDIPHAVMEASAAASAATEGLSAVRHTRTRTVQVPAETDVVRQRPRIGVFVCNCGINIGGVVRVPEVAAYAQTLPGVVYVEENLFTCSQDTQDKMTAVIRQQNLNRVVVAACTPRTHEGLFQETLISAGLNKYLFEMANIRNHDSWVHADDPDAATQKAKDLVRMAVAKSALSTPLPQSDLPLERSALVVGGGLVGMTAALSLARQGYPVHLVEKSASLGGHAARLIETASGDAVEAGLKAIEAQVESNVRITVYREAAVEKVEGFVGNFRTAIATPKDNLTIDHGVAILATGAREYQPREYLYGQHAAVLTHLELDDLFRHDDPRLTDAQDVVFIQCVGSREPERPYCSKVCCTHTMQSALRLIEKNPAVNVYVLYRDIRTYGKREALYQAARKKGVLFFRYALEDKPGVTADGKRLQVDFTDTILGRKLSVDADLLCLAAAIVPRDSTQLARLFKVPTDSDGWLLEAHQKLRPVDFATEGVFLCGMAHYPKPIDESIAQAKAAAARAAVYLAMDHIRVGGIVTRIDAKLCSGCGGCIDVCPFGAIGFNAEAGVAEVNPALCKGCGACAAACPSEAPVLMGFTNGQLYAQIKNAFAN